MQYTPNSDEVWSSGRSLLCILLDHSFRSIVFFSFIRDFFVYFFVYLLFSKYGFLLIIALEASCRFCECISGRCMCVLEFKLGFLCMPILLFLGRCRSGNQVFQFPITPLDIPKK